MPVNSAAAANAPSATNIATKDAVPAGNAPDGPGKHGPPANGHAIGIKDADGEADADGDADGDAMDIDAAGSSMEQGELLELIHEVAAFLCEYKEDGEDEELAIGFQRLPNRRLLPSYFEVISTPMAFSTIRGKINKKQYTNFSQFVRDVAQITHNAQVFNRPSAGIFGAAVRLQALFQSELKKLVAKGTISPAEAVLPDLGELPSADESSGGEDEEEEEEDDDDEEEDDEEREEKAARQRSRKRGEPKRRGRPPRVLTPTEARIVAIIRGIREVRAPNGTLLIEPFLELPDRDNNPAYYKVITQPIAVNQIQRKSDRKKYRTVDDVIRDFKTMFTNALTYNEDGSELFKTATQLLQRLSLLANEQLQKPDNSFRDVSGRLPLTQTLYSGITWRVGDWVHLVNPNKGAKPIVAQIFRMWTDNAGQTWINACWYFRPEQTVHRSDKQFYNLEVFKTNQYHDHRIEEVIDACFVMFIGLYTQGRPRGLSSNKIIYVCESRYNEEKYTFKKIKAWSSCMPDELRDAEYSLDMYPALRQMVKIPSPIKHLLRADAKETDPIPQPHMGHPHAPPSVGAVYKRPGGPNDSPPPNRNAHIPAPQQPILQHPRHHIPSPAPHTAQPPLPPHGYHPSPAPPMASPSPSPGQPFMMPHGQVPMPYHPHHIPMHHPHPHPHPHHPPPPHMQGHFAPPPGVIPPQMPPMQHLPPMQHMPHQSPVPVPVPPGPYQGMPGAQPVRGMHPQPPPGYMPHMPPHPHHQQFVPPPHHQFAPSPMPVQQIPPPPQPMPAPPPHQHHYSMPPRPMPIPPPVFPQVAIPSAPSAAMSGPRPEVFTLEEEANRKMPKELSAKFHTDDKGRILFFAAPPLARPHAGLSARAAAMGHSVKYLAGRDEWLAERERKRKESHDAEKEKEDKERVHREAKEKVEKEKVLEAAVDGFGKWCNAHLQETERMFGEGQVQVKRVKQV